ncbi:hypothetical protein J6590_044952 [Homalodisca vitripennis]|nr:hypothetical protein J6590_044952 [Homalodisca vitripennis]
MGISAGARAAFTNSAPLGPQTKERPPPEDSDYTYAEIHFDINTLYKRRKFGVLGKYPIAERQHHPPPQLFSFVYFKIYAPPTILRPRPGPSGPIGKCGTGWSLYCLL